MKSLILLLFVATSVFASEQLLSGVYRILPRRYENFQLDPIKSSYLTLSKLDENNSFLVWNVTRLSSGSYRIQTPATGPRMATRYWTHVNKQPQVQLIPRMGETGQRWAIVPVEGLYYKIEMPYLTQRQIFYLQSYYNETESTEAVRMVKDEVSGPPQQFKFMPTVVPL